MLHSMQLLALILAAGMIAALWRDRLRTRTRCATLLRRVRRQRDAYAACLEQAGDEYEELHLAHEELLRETLAYRQEDARREAVVREKRLRLN